MKYAILAVTLFLAGCAGLNVAWSLSATYNTATQVQMPHAEKPAQPASGAK